MGQLLGVFALFAFFIGSYAYADSRSESPPPTVYLIPGSGSSGEHIYIQGLNKLTKAIGKDRYFREYQRELAKVGVASRVCPQTEDKDRRSIAERAEECIAMILDDLGEQDCTNGADRSVSLFGHSMGGLIARQIAGDKRVKTCIHSVTTISTPHLGSPLADLAIAWWKKDQTSGHILGKVVELIGFTPDKLAYLPSIVVERSDYPKEIFLSRDLQPTPGVRYYSIASGMSHSITPFLEITRTIIADEQKKRGLPERNDGMVPISSMSYGEYLGEVDANHWEAACVDPVAFMPGCKKTLAVVIPHLRMLLQTTN